MNTDKLTTIDDEALNDVAGGSLGEAVGGLIDAGIELGLSNFKSAVDHHNTRLKDLNKYISTVKKALLGS